MNMTINTKALQAMGLDESATAALMRVLQVESPEATAIRAKAQLVQNAPVIETMSPDASAWQIIYRSDLPHPENELLSVQISGIALADSVTSEPAQMYVRLGQNFVPERFFESLESNREYQRLVRLGAIQASPPGHHIDLGSLPKVAIESFAYAAIFYAKNDAAVRAVAPHLPAGKAKQELLAHLAKKAEQDAAQAEPSLASLASAPVPAPTAQGGLEVTYGARVAALG